MTTLGTQGRDVGPSEVVIRDVRLAVQAGSGAARTGGAGVAGPPVDLILRDGLIAAIEPTRYPGDRYTRPRLGGRGTATDPSDPDDGTANGTAPDSRTGTTDANGPAVFDAGGAFAFPGFVDAHVHLDKAHILDRCRGGAGLAQAVAQVRAAKRGFTVEDVRDRAARVLRRAIVNGTTRMRSYVEVDPDAGLRSFEALAALRDEYAHAVDLRLSAFAQDGTTQAPRTLGLLRRALEQGADEVGGCPYTDADPGAHVRAIFDLAVEFDVPVDFHVDFDLDPSWEHLSLVVAETRRHGWGGRTSVGHVTKLSALAPADRLAVAGRLADAGIGLVVLPATDLFLSGRDAERLVPRGVAPAVATQVPGLAMAVATNNVVNPFTPFGDADLLRMANLYAIVGQLETDDDLRSVFGMVSAAAEAIVGGARRIEVGASADVVLLDAPDPVTALRECVQPLAGWKAGRQTFLRPRPRLLADGLGRTSEAGFGEDLVDQGRPGGGR
ncbi:amidohydrolase family protein [Pseudofrankia inefficax]|uniref:Amidohydrolase 3 n=1 Tax=Pseudofrankia inefficax (strain DSM 45817 / CECT 9037 / DDB 130130 / EuI1c) TaxID=298654 RepID=E3IZE5_PSEI1|nr:amidohydrolase family protein [Pseudofrankia inefficax]ADP82715.1 Amidohydrolase 3 [Pseudofrankia inefficax]